MLSWVFRISRNSQRNYKNTANIFFCALALSSFRDLNAQELSKLSQEAVFVSLGPNCSPAFFLKTCDFREFSCPFDWIKSFNTDLLIELLNDNFLYFFDDRFLFPELNKSELLNTQYHLSFIHDGDFTPSFYNSSLVEFKKKFSRRIERFRNLANSEKKVFFIRESFLTSLHPMKDFSRYEASSKVSEEQANSLQNALKKLFPHLDFSVVIIECDCDCSEEVIVEIKPSNGIYFVKMDQRISYDKRLKNHKLLYSLLLDSISPDGLISH